MADDRIRISWDEVKDPRVDDELRRQATAGASPTVLPWAQQSDARFASPEQSPRPSMSGPLFLPLIVGGMAMLLLVAVLVIAARFAGDSAEQGGSSQPHLRTAALIESVLQQDSTARHGVQTVAEYAVRLRAIPLTGCPNDFRSAYVAHLHAWELMAEVERDAAAYKAENEIGAVMVESFIRGFLGDPFGKVNEITAAENQLQQSLQLASQKIRDTFQRVEEIAVAHGANLPKAN